MHGGLIILQRPCRASMFLTPGTIGVPIKLVWGTF